MLTTNTDTLRKSRRSRMMPLKSSIHAGLPNTCFPMIYRFGSPRLADPLGGEASDSSTFARVQPQTLRPAQQCSLRLFDPLGGEALDSSTFPILYLSMMVARYFCDNDRERERERERANNAKHIVICIGGSQGNSFRGMADTSFQRT